MVTSHVISCTDKKRYRQKNRYIIYSETEIQINGWRERQLNRKIAV